MVPPLVAAVAHLPLAADPPRATAVPGDAVLLDEGSGNGRPNDLAGGDRHSVELAEAHDQSWEP